MPSIKAAYIFTDLEGVAGVDDWDPRHSDYATLAKGVYERAEMQRLLTGEVNAAAEGLFAAGVQEILVNDAHGAGRTILVEELISGVQIVRGRDRPGWVLGLSPRFDALVQVGMHPMAGTPAGCLAPSFVSRRPFRNGSGWAFFRARSNSPGLTYTSSGVSPLSCAKALRRSLVLGKR